MLYPSIQELLKKTEKNGEETLNKYSLVMATAKCARVITNEYLKERSAAERKIANKEIEAKDIGAYITKRYRDEKAVKNAVHDLNNGEFEVYLPGEDGYDTSVVDVIEYEDTAKEEKRSYRPQNDYNSADFKDDSSDDEDLIGEDEFEDEEDVSTDELMGGTTVFEGDEGYSIEESDE